MNGNKNMCGIAGYVDFGRQASSGAIVEMLREIMHRGPDSEGTYISRNKKAFLGVRRLSIIDLTTGDQPIKNEQGSVIVTYNGEIYNYKSLREALSKKGHKFSTSSDTEVLAHLYEKYGEELSKYLNGMFAFAIWDEEREKLVLSRDRAGVKPLYYYKKGNLLIYGSEVKAESNLLTASTSRAISAFLSAAERDFSKVHVPPYLGSARAFKRAPVSLK
jgi:asparagine synthase (glutamine-hydrolysing)